MNFYKDHEISLDSIKELSKVFKILHQKFEQVGKQQQRSNSKIENAPKRGASAYNLFYKDKCLEFQNQNPDSNHIEISKLLGQAWKNCSIEEVQKYKEKANLIKVEYQKQLAKFNQNNQFNDNQIDHHKIPQQISEQNRQKLKEIKKEYEDQMAKFSDLQRGSTGLMIQNNILNKKDKFQIQISESSQNSSQLSDQFSSVCSDDYQSHSKIFTDAQKNQQNLIVLDVSDSEADVVKKIKLF